MDRFCGMMPSAEVEKVGRFKDCYGKLVIIEAEQNGWSVIYIDGSTVYKDETLSTDENFTNAYDVANQQVGPLSNITRKD